MIRVTFLELDVDLRPCDMSLEDANTMTASIPATRPTQQTLEITQAGTILIKIGTEVVSEDDGHIALGRIGNVIQQIHKLYMQGKRIIIVSSGAVGIGKILLRKQHMLSGSLQEHIEGRSTREVQLQLKACAAAGQSGLQALYGTLLSNYDVLCSQILVSDSDFHVEESCQNLRKTMTTLLDLGIIPIINENDVISSRVTPLTDELGKVAWDNDSLATLVAKEMCVDLLIIMTDVSGIYRKTKGGREVVPTYCESDTIIPSMDSRVGLLGQHHKIQCALSAVNSTKVKHAIIANAKLNSISDIFAGKVVGTLFSRHSGSLQSHL